MSIDMLLKIIYELELFANSERILIKNTQLLKSMFYYVQR